jgi:hypothetical protein
MPHLLLKTMHCRPICNIQRPFHARHGEAANRNTIAGSSLDRSTVNTGIDCALFLIHVVRNLSSSGLAILVLAQEYENMQFSCCFEAYSRLISYPLFLTTFIGALLVLTELEGIQSRGDHSRNELYYHF